MANIPVEHKSGAAWLPWLIGLLVVGGLIWLVAELFDNEPDADELAGMEDNVGVIDDVELGDDADMALTDPNELYDYDYAAAPLDGTTSTDASGTMEGREVDFEMARVLNVVGDSAFYIGADDNRRVLVVLAGLGESELGAEGTDGRFNVDVGDTVSISGEVVRFQDGMPGTYSLSDADRQRMLERPLFVRVNSASDISSPNEIQTSN